MASSNPVTYKPTAATEKEIYKPVKLQLLTANCVHFWINGETKKSIPIDVTDEIYKYYCMYMFAYKSKKVTK